MAEWDGVGHCDLQGVGCEVPHLHLKRPHLNKLLSDAPQNKKKKLACGATIIKKKATKMRNSNEMWAPNSIKTIKTDTNQH